MTTAVAICLCWIGAPPAQPDAAPNVWTKLERAQIVGQRWDVPVGYSPDLKRFLVLGGRTSWAEYKKPRPYDVLALNGGEWENWFPRGKEWGPRVGACQVPAWKDELFHFGDLAGNVRPNWTVYGTFSLGQKYDYDSHHKCFVFYAGGRTFRFNPATREWADLAPANDPQRELGGVLLWSSLCYDAHHRRFVLFGGGNVQTERGDPGTWTYSPETNAWQRLALEKQPPPRANSRLAFDPVAKKIVLFGGDQLNQLLADTWTFDVVANEWHEQRPPLGPAPRAGHALLWLPRQRKILLLGGYTYTSAVGYVERLYKPLPLEAWTFDSGRNAWQRVQLSPPLKKENAWESPANFFLSAAVADDDTVLVVANGGTWQCALDASAIDEAGTVESGVTPGTVTRRSGPHDPAWFQQDVPAADPGQVEKELRSLAENRWTLRPTPKLPKPNMDWGSAVFAANLDLIVRFSGGHSAYSGTAPQVYDVKTDRYSLAFAPEYPIEYVYSNDQVYGEWNFRGNPWMTGHTYKSTGYDARLKCLVFAPHEFTYFFDPRAGRWSRGPERNPYRPDFYVNTLCDTPDGAIVWADHRPGQKSGAGLWRLHAETKTWQPLPLRGELPAKNADHHGLAFDSRRNRLLFFSDLGANRGDVAEYDLATGEARWLGAAGRERAAVHSRETIYIPESDLVLVGAHVTSADGRTLWPCFDCAKNAWFSIELPGDDPVGKGAFNVSLGLMYDPHRKLVWAVGQNSHVHVLRLNAEPEKRQRLDAP